MENGSLDDSLTSIQWLCQLESNKLLKAKSEKRMPVTSTPINRSDDNNNPYRKPHYSYASLIVLAINSARDKRMTLQSIYAWIEDNFPFYRFAKKGWKNSIRHNLSLHKFFIKEQRADVLCGKGSFWRISPEGKENLIRDLLKPPVHNLQPPIALLPHDPNRKLRHILPKPSFDTTGMQYVPVIDYNQLPIMLLPTTNDAGASISQDPISQVQNQTVPLQVQRNSFASPIQQSVVCSTTKSAGLSTFVGSASNVMSRSQNVESVDKYQVCKDEIESFDSAFSAATPAVCAPTQDQRKHSKSKTAVRKSKDKEVSSRRQRSHVSKKSKRVPNILRKSKMFSVKTPDVQEARIQTPLKNSVQSTLAAINSSNHTPYSPNRRVDDLVNLLNVPQSSPPGLNRSFEFLHGFGSPGISPLRSPGCFSSTGFTPLGYGECDSGIVITPMKSTLGDMSFNWTPFKTGLTPLSSSKSQSNSNNTQRCRKSLGLEQINEATEYTESDPCW